MNYSVSLVTCTVLKESSFLSRDRAMESLLTTIHTLLHISFGIPSFCFKKGLPLIWAFPAPVLMSLRGTVVAAALVEVICVFSVIW